jgi:hypothetical protein
MMLDHGIMTFLYHINGRHEIDPVRDTITLYFKHFRCIGMISSQENVYEELQKLMVGSVP